LTSPSLFLARPSTPTIVDARSTQVDSRNLLGHQRFTKSRGTRALATLLQSHTHPLFQKLDISRQEVLDDRSYFYLLTEALQVNTMLISLNVSSNFLDDSHLRKLAKALTINSTLQELYMGGNSFHSWEGIVAFSERMPFMNGLQCLRMTNQRLTNYQLDLLVQGLKENLTFAKACFG
jgi:hypothetical protein